MHQISIGIVEDHELAREGLTTLLVEQSELRVAGAVADGAGLRVLISEDPPDVILMDIKLGEENGLELTRWLQLEHPNVRVIILSNFDEGPFVIEAISAGAVGYLLKDCTTALLLHTISAVTDGAMLFKKELLTRAFAGIPMGASENERNGVQSLSEEEFAVLTLMETGTRNRLIGIALHLSQATVKKRVQSILLKLNAANRTEAVAVAIRVGPPDSTGTRPVGGLSARQ